MNAQLKQRQNCMPSLPFIITFKKDKKRNWKKGKKKKKLNKYEYVFS